MLAAILNVLNEPLAVDDVLLPEALTAGQVLVRVHASGICGKQLNEISGACGQDKFLPHLLGHEGAGVVRDVGPGVEIVKAGDHIVLHWRKGRGLEGAFPRYRWRDCYAGGGAVTTFNEYAVVSENRLTKIHPAIPFDIAALMGCAVTTGLGVIFNDAELQAGQSVCVIGCGGVGLNVIQGARIAKAAAILAIDNSDEKLLMAIEFGATSASKQFADAKSRKLDLIVDTTGRPELIAQAFDLAAPGGKVVMVGQPPRGMDLVLRDVASNMKGKTLMDSAGGGTRPEYDIPWYLGMWQRGDLKLKELITHRFPLERVNDALAVSRSGKAGRVILEMA